MIEENADIMVFNCLAGALSNKQSKRGKFIKMEEAPTVWGSDLANNIFVPVK